MDNEISVTITRTDKSVPVCFTSAFEFFEDKESFWRRELTLITHACNVVSMPLRVGKCSEGFRRHGQPHSVGPAEVQTVDPGSVCVRGGREQWVQVETRRGGVRVAHEDAGQPGEWTLTFAPYPRCSGFPLSGTSPGSIWLGNIIHFFFFFLPVDYLCNCIMLFHFQNNTNCNSEIAFFSDVCFLWKLPTRFISAPFCLLWVLQLSLQKTSASVCTSVFLVSLNGDLSGLQLFQLCAIAAACPTSPSQAPDATTSCGQSKPHRPHIHLPYGLRGTRWLHDGGEHKNTRSFGCKESASGSTETKR